MKFTFITLFPEIIRAYLNESIIKKAVEKSLIAFETIDPKDFLESKERIDDKVLSKSINTIEDIKNLK